MIPNQNYILDDENRPVLARDIEEWGRFFENFERRRVASDKVDDWQVSTVFIGIDHRFSGTGPPLLFETMVFDEEGHDQETHRYSSWDDAITGHRATVRRLQETRVKPR